MAKYFTIQNNVDTSITSGTLVGQLGFAASNDSDGGDAIVITAAVIASADGTFDATNNPGSLVFATSPTGPATGQIKIVDSGHLEPIGNKIKNLGSSSSQWKDLYVDQIYFDGLGPQTLPFNDFNVAANTDSVTVIDGNTITFTGAGDNIVSRDGQTIIISGTGGGGGTTYTADSGIELQGSTFVMGGTGALDKLTISSQSSSEIPLIVQGAASQSTNLQEWQDSAGSIRLALDEDGVFQTSTPISAVFIRDSQRSNCLGFPDGNLCISTATTFTYGVTVRDGGATVNRNRGFYWNSSSLLYGGAADTALLRPSAGNVILVAGNGLGSPRGELSVTGVDLGYIDFADGTTQTTAYTGQAGDWKVGVSGLTDTIISGETVTFTGLGSTSVTYNESTNTVSISGAAGGGGTPGGSDTHVQFNDGGSTFGGNAGFTYDKTAQKMYSRSYYTNITDSGNITSSVTLDLDQSNFHQVTLSGNPITIAVANGDVGQRFIIRLKQDNTGSRTVNWFSTISWPGGGPPALSTATGVADLLGFVVTAANEYDGFLMVSGIY